MLHIRQETGRQESDEEGLVKKAALVMIKSTPPNKESRSRKRKGQVEEASLSAEAVSEANMKETAPMVWADRRLQLTETTRRLGN